MAAGSISLKPPPVPLLATRFFLPPLPASCVSRPRLLHRLATGLDRPLILVSAPAGFGKSSLVSEWIRSQPGLAFSWLTLEPPDNEWRQFFRYLVAAWQQIYPQAGAVALTELESASFSNTETLVNALLNDLATSQYSNNPGHSWVVLDDYHSIISSGIHKSVAYLIEHLPPHCHMVLITRTDPPLPLARWRSRGQLVEVRANELRFNSDEAAEFLKHSMRLNLSDEQTEILEARTEGWITGLQLSALSLQGREETQAFVQAFRGSHRFVLDYLIEEVLDHQSEEIKTFLLATAVLEKLCAPLCDALLETASPHSQQMLIRLEKANLFLIPLDDQQTWFRYHHLFADLLLVRLRQAAPDKIFALNMRAAHWYAKGELWRDAIYYALQAGDFEYGANLFEKAVSAGGLDFLYSGMQALIAPFPAEWLERSPVMRLAKAFSMIETSQLAGIRPLLRAAEQEFQTSLSFKGQSQFLGMVYVAQSIAASMLGDSPGIIKASRHVTRLLPGHAKASVSALLQLGNAYFYEGNLHQIDSYWQQALDISLANHYPFGILCGLDDLGRLCCYKGELNRAEMYFQRAFDLLDKNGTRSPRWLGATQRDYSELLRERNHLEDAQAVMTSSLALLEKWDSVSGQALGYIHMGRIFLAQENSTAANTMLQKAEKLCQSHTVYPDLKTLLEVFRAQLLMETGDLNSAWKRLETCLGLPIGQHEFHREWILIAQARILIQKMRPADALALLTGRMDLARKHGRGRNWLEIILLTAMAMDMLGEHTRSFDMLKDGLTYARSQGFLRIFVDEGRMMYALLQQFPRQFSEAPFVDYITCLLNGFPRQAGLREPPCLTDELIQPLSLREVEILRLLCDGLSNREIADQLILSVGTVKTHVHNIYGKLGVRDRPQAIARAVRHGILSK